MLQDVLQHPEMPVALPRCDNPKCLQVSPNVPWEVKLTPVENHWARPGIENVS